MDAIRWLFIGTAMVTLLANPVFGLLVSRFRRLVVITATYGFFAGLAALAVPHALVRAGLGLWLVLTQRRIARHRDQAGAPAAAVASTSS